MTTNSLSNWPSLVPEAQMTPFSTTKPRRQRAGVVKLLTPPSPPDQYTIEKLNALAAQHPFCALHRVKKHDTL